MREQGTQFAFKGKREHIVKVSISNIVYSNQNINIKIRHVSKDHVIVAGTVKITFDLDI